MIKSKNKNIYRILLENLPQKIFLKNKNSVYISCNENYARGLKIKVAEIYGKTDLDFYSKKLAEKYMMDDKRIIKSGITENIEEEHVLDGRKIFTHTVKTPVRDDNGNITGILGIFWDVSKEKRMREELQKYHTKLESMVNSRTVALKKEIVEHKIAEERIIESEERFRQVMENSNDWIWVLDTKGNFVVVNNQAEIASGYKLKNWKKESFASLIHPDDLKMANRVFRKTLLGKRQQYGVKIYDKNGKIIILSVNTAPMYKMGKVEGTVSFGRDITKRKNAEQALQKQKLVLEQKNIALSEIIAQIEVEKRKIKDNIAANVNESLLPILDKLKLENTSGKYIDLLKTHLEELTSSFGRKIRGKRLNLTSREIEICNMIKGKLTSKEISNLLNISYQTVEKHRKNIRRKMGISGKDINLISFLQTI